MLNVQFHLFQEIINQFTAVIVLENTNQMIEMTEVEEMTEVQDHHMGVIHLDLILDQAAEEVTNF
jgi:hypothetical protein